MRRDDLDLTWETSDTRPHIPRTPRPRECVTREEATRRRRTTVAVLAVLAVVLVFSLGRCSGLAGGNRIAQDAMLETAEAQSIAAAAVSERDYWHAEATEASGTIDTLRSALATATARLDTYARQAAEASAAIETTGTDGPR